MHDLSVEMEGHVAFDGHLYGNDQWAFIQLKRNTIGRRVVDKWPDSVFLPMQTRVTISRYFKDKANKYPPKFQKSVVPFREKPEGSVPMISIGRYGTMLRRHRPSDDAILAMLRSAKSVLRMASQDLGPFCVPYTKVTLPGCVRPKRYMKAMADVMMLNDAKVEIALSNPRSIPADCSWTDAIYGNGWTCVDVAAEIMLCIKELYPKTTDDELRKILRENLRVCFIREKVGEVGNSWADGRTMGMHAKHFIVDDVLCYIGSQNLYIWYV